MVATDDFLSPVLVLELVLGLGPELEPAPEPDPEALLVAVICPEISIKKNGIVMSVWPKS